MRVYLNLDLSANSNQNRLLLTVDDTKQESLKVGDVCGLIKDTYGLETSEFIVVSETGTSLAKSKPVQDGDTLRLLPTVLGGKGGFGSLIRSFGKQIAKSTNKDACRDLTGRRIKHVNEEKKIKEYINKQAEIAQQKEEAKKERLERRRKKREYLENGNRAQFLDPEYLKQMDKINEDLNEAIKTATGAKKRKKSSDESDDEEAESSKPTTSSASASSTKAAKEESDSKPCSSAQAELKGSAGAKAKSASKPVNKNLKGWMGVDVDVSSSDDEEEEEDAKTVKKTKKC